MLKQIIAIVIKNRRDYDGMTIEIITLLSRYSNTAKRLLFFIHLDIENECQSMEVSKDKVILEWRKW